MGLMIEQDLYYIPGFDAVVGGNGFSVDPHVSGVRSRLNTVAARIGHVLSKVFIDSLFTLPFIYFAPPTFPEFFIKTSFHRLLYFHHRR